jgi:hypothetical protein
MLVVVVAVVVVVLVLVGHGCHRARGVKTRRP